MEITDILKRLCEPCMPSGFEDACSDTVADMLKPYCDSVEKDRLGNIIGFKACGDDNAETVMLDAHMDQIGFIVTDVDDEGFLKVKNIGGIDERLLPACEVMILTEPPVYGVFTSVPPHIQKNSDMKKSMPLDRLRIDSGLSGKAKEIIKIGTPVVFADGLHKLCGDAVSAKSIDDRAGICALIYAMDMLSHEKINVNIALCVTSREEIGGAGARVAAFGINPDIALAVDVSHAQTHDCSNDETFKFGGGTLVGISPLLDRKMSQNLIKLAKAKGISYQTEVMEGSTGTNAHAIQTVREGIPCALLSIPIKYMHTPIETVNLNDIKATGHLISEFIKSR